MNKENRFEDMTYSFIMICAAFLSLAGTSFVAWTIFRSKKLRNIHPAKLIMVLSLIEFCTCWVVMWHAVGPVKMTCYTGLNRLLY